MIDLKKYLSQETINPELKKEHELNNDDRMFLINKKIDENFLLEIYENLIEKKKYIINDNGVIINDYVFNDVEFLQDHYLDDSKSIFSRLDYCNTRIGSLLLKKIFLNPIYDIESLKKRQDIFLRISSIKNKLIPLLTKIKMLEHDLMWFWNNSNIKHIDLMNDLIYFNYDIIPFFNLNDVLNNNEKALLITNIYKIIISPMLTILTPLISLILPLIFLFYMQRKTKINIPMSVILKQYLKTIFGHDSMKMVFTNPTKAIIASVVTKGIYLFMYIQNIYYSLQSSSNTNKIINIIHEKLNKINLYNNLTKEIFDVCKNHKINNVTSYIDYNNIENDISFYNDYFNYPVFNSIPQLFSNKGKILTTFKKFKDNKDNMINLFHYTGIIDAILSIDNVLSKSTPEYPYSTTIFLNRNEPTINVEDMWHPYLNNEITDNTVKNSVDINNNILITGPNAAGKSTFIKSIIINIILSQTIGISSSKKFELTPFNMIETYLHIPDTKGTSSLFEAEMLRSKDYIDKIKNMEDNKFSFIVLDEIFSSTNYIEGFSGAYAILKKISSFPNTLSITTTHYTDLEILEKDTKGKILNYKFDIDYNDNNEIIFNYKLKRGVSTQYIALELLKNNGFDKDVIETAIDICKKIKDRKIIFFKKSKKTKKTKKNNKSLSDK